MLLVDQNLLRRGSAPRRHREVPHETRGETLSGVGLSNLLLLHLQRLQSGDQQAEGRHPEVKSLALLQAQLTSVSPRKYGRYARNVLRKKGLIPPKELNAHPSLSLKSNGTASIGGLKTLNGSTRHQQTILSRTPEPVRRSLTLANTRSPKSGNERVVTNNVSTLAATAPTTIHECDEGILANNNSDDEEEDRLSTAIDETNNYATISNETKSLERFSDSFVYKDFLRQGLIATGFASSRATMRTTTVTSLTSTASLPVASNLNENILATNNGQALSSANNTCMNTLLSSGSEDSFRISHINRNFGFCRR